jgi:hypothetical protein
VSTNQWRFFSLLNNSESGAAREGHDFYSLRKNSLLQLLLGGAAVYRCDNWFIFIDGFSR